MTDATALARMASDAEAANLPRVVTRNRQRVGPRFLRRVARLAGRLPFADDLVAAYVCARDPATPRRVKAVLFAALAYFVTPLDMVPDIIIALGFTDDATVLAAALGVVGMSVTPRHRARARAILGLTAPRS